MPCTAACGCTSTSTRASGSENRRAASITSRPLFIIVALSMEILAPIDQTGWRSAASGVARAISSRLAVRNGPPEEVSTIRSTDAGIALGERLEHRVVLGIDRQQGGAGLANGAQHHLAGAHQRLLVGQRHARARARIAASVAGRPAAPVIAAIVQSAPRDARLDHRLRPGGGRDAAARERLGQRRRRRRGR